ncbi:MAG: hypothetical protein II921_09025 [Treponema sp.]|nr:hypothetical protein [Treponema sp.]
MRFSLKPLTARLRALSQESQDFYWDDCYNRSENDNVFSASSNHFSFTPLTAQSRALSQEPQSFYWGDSSTGNNKNNVCLEQPKRNVAFSDSLERFSLEPYIVRVRKIADDCRYKRSSNFFFDEEADDGLGPNYAQYHGMEQDAIYHLLEERKGQVKGAFFRYDIGEIDVVWGEVLDSKKHTGYGLAHIIDKHGKEAVDKIGFIIKNGTLRKGSAKNRVKIVSSKKELILATAWNGAKRNIIITSFDKTQPAKT